MPYNRSFVMLNSFQHNTRRYFVILKRVQDDEFGWEWLESAKHPLENRIDVLQMITKVEFVLDLLLRQRSRYIGIGL
jgi:hypothetical protein